MRRRRRGTDAGRVNAVGRQGLDVAREGQAYPYIWRLGAPRAVNNLLLNLLAVVVLSASFAPMDMWPLAYVALVPWAMALAGARRGGWAVAAAGAAGLVFWAGNLYWLWWITLSGYFALVAYLTLYWVVGGLVVRGALRQGRPAWLVLPVVWTALEFARAYVISGFPWYYLAHTQYAQTAIIQVADATGQYGVTFFVAMVNGALVDLLRWWLARRAQGEARPRVPARALIATAATAVAILGYGLWRLGQETTTPGPVVGLVQQAVPNRLGERGTDPDEVFEHYLRSSLTFGRERPRCDLVVWSEAVLRGVNPEFLAADTGDVEGLRKAMGRYAWGGAFDRASIEEVKDAWQRLRKWTLRDLEALAGLTRQLQCPLLLGAGTIHYDAREKDWQEFNATLWFDVGGRVTGEYAKMHPVPFSEYIPFRRSWPWMYGLLRSLVPPVMPPLEPGREMVRFELSRPGGGRAWRLATPICFEGTFAQVCRQMVYEGGAKRADMLVNVSNDGWFVLPGEGARPSTEHRLHLSQYCFRAVESRVPVLRAANTGISASIDSCGRIVSEMGTGPGARAMKTLVDGRVSLYSMVGEAFAGVVSVASVALATWVFWRSRKKKVAV